MSTPMHEQGEPGSAGAPSAVLTDDLVESRHSLLTETGELTYTTLTGRIVLRDESYKDGHYQGLVPKAEFFVIAYTLDGADPLARPVTFAFNGGPGSSSVWLHLGLLGPRRVVVGDVGALAHPPYRVGANPESLLAESDLVFIDPVSTGYSRAAPGEDPKGFHGFQGDVESVGELIRLWISRNERWMSPKYLAGESYGTLRACALANHLQKRLGIYLNGLILISLALDGSTMLFTEGNDLPFAFFLPTYASIAHYHGLLGTRSLAEVRAEAEELAERDYLWALTRGSRLHADERAEMVRRIARVTGLSERYVADADLRIENARFFRELLRSRGLVVGRLDGRFTGWERDNGSERPTHDPGSVALYGAYSAAINSYVRTELRFRSDLPYEVTTDRVQPWSYAEFEARQLTVSPLLAEAMRHNPHLRVYVACGYYDAGTPYFAAEHALAHLAIPSELRGNIELHHYGAGHMMYVHEQSRLQQSAAVGAFVRQSVGTSTVGWGMHAPG